MASTMSSLMLSRSILGGAASSLADSTLVASVGEGGGVVSMMAESEEACDRLMRLLAWESGDCDREDDDGREVEAEAEDGRPALLEAAAARAALVTGM